MSLNKKGGNCVKQHKLFSFLFLIMGLPTGSRTIKQNVKVVIYNIYKINRTVSADVE